MVSANSNNPGSDWTEVIYSTVYQSLIKSLTRYVLSNLHVCKWSRNHKHYARPFLTFYLRSIYLQYDPWPIYPHLSAIPLPMHFNTAPKSAFIDQRDRWVNPKALRFLWNVLLKEGEQRNWSCRLVL